jgi:hypothetical protein
MKAKFCSLIAGVSLLALASASNAGQLLTDKQMDGVVAGFGNWNAVANAGSVALGNFDSVTFTATNTFTSQVENVAVAQSTATGQAASAITFSIVAVGSNAAAACVGTGC